MSDERPYIIIRPMRLSDVETVVETDTMSFPTPWPAGPTGMRSPITTALL
jgi:hypothetical protein